MLNLKKTVDKVLREYEGLDQGFWLTLNSPYRVASFGDGRFQGLMEKLDPMVEKFMHQLNEKCFGRRYQKDPKARLKSLGCYEIGSEGGLVHCHILALHDGSTDRTLEEVAQISKWKWGGICKAASGDRCTNVQPLGDKETRL